MRPVVVDTNILFSALLRDASPFTAEILGNPRRFVVNELVLTELFRHKEKIVRLSGLQDREVVHLYHELIRTLDLFKESLLSPQARQEAYQLCKDIDVTDTPHVAITIELDGLLWTGDKRLKQGLEAKGFKQFYKMSARR